MKTVLRVSSPQREGRPRTEERERERERERDFLGPANHPSSNRPLACTGSAPHHLLAAEAGRATRRGDPVGLLPVDAARDALEERQQARGDLCHMLFSPPS